MTIQSEMTFGVWKKPGTDVIRIYVNNTGNRFGKVWIGAKEKASPNGIDWVIQHSGDWFGCGQYGGVHVGDQLAINLIGHYFGGKNPTFQQIVDIASK